MDTSIKTRYQIKEKQIIEKFNIVNIQFPLFKTTVLAKKKINPKLAYNKELLKSAGVGITLAKWLTNASGCRLNSINGTTNRKVVTQTNDYILHDTDFLTEKKLYWFKKNQKKLLWSVFSYHNFRRKKGLPIRGQRTKTNASTARKFSSR